MAWCVGAGCGLLALAGPVAADGDAVSGRKISEQHCSRCHVIGDYNKYGGIGSTPSFQGIVKYMPDYRERFATFFSRRPHPAFLTIKGQRRPMPHLPPNAVPVTLPDTALADLVAFAETFVGTK
ncbi:MAG TPA: hypothetical protein VMX97_02440 [Hyphomicrobiaceae bacterium]|nr:hypothetical protein [Hyphomicrobiaceae bacterium]